MPFKPIAKEIKGEVLRRIKEEGLSVPQASKEYGINTKTIYNWIGNYTSKNGINPILRENKLKKEISNLHEIIGIMTVELNKQKKGL